MSSLVTIMQGIGFAIKPPQAHLLCISDLCNIVSFICTLDCIILPFHLACFAFHSLQINMCECSILSQLKLRNVSIRFPLYIPNLIKGYPGVMKITDA